MFNQLIWLLESVIHLYRRVSYSQIFGVIYVGVAFHILFESSSATTEVLKSMGIPPNLFALVLLTCGLIVVSKKGNFGILSVPFVMYCLTLAHEMSHKSIGMALTLIGLWLVILRIIVEPS